LKGLALLQQGRVKDALPAFDEVLAVRPELLIALFGRAAAHARNGDFLQAVADVTHALKLIPEDAEAFTVRGEYHSERKDFASAEKDFYQAISLAGQNPQLLSRWLRAVTAKLGGAVDAGEPPSPAPVDPPRGPDTGASMKDPTKGSSSIPTPLNVLARRP
jgi:tetratricopeptide (TPR) repeat protein